MVSPREYMAPSGVGSGELPVGSMISLYLVVPDEVTKLLPTELPVTKLSHRLLHVEFFYRTPLCPLP